MEIQKKKKEKYPNIGFRAKRKIITWESMGFTFYLAELIVQIFLCLNTKSLRRTGVRRQSPYRFFTLGVGVKHHPTPILVTGKEFLYSLVFWNRLEAMAKKRIALGLFAESRTPVRKQMCYGEMPFLPVCRMWGSLTLCSGCLWALPRNSPLYVSGFDLHSLSELPASINTHLQQRGFFRSSTQQLSFPSLIIVKTLRIYG